MGIRYEDALDGDATAVAAVKRITANGGAAARLSDLLGGPR